MIIVMTVANRWADPFVNMGYGEITLECAELRLATLYSPEWWLMGRWTVDVSSAEVAGGWKQPGHYPPCYCPVHTPELIPAGGLHANGEPEPDPPEPKRSWRPWRR